jgi:hypothetical protein
MEGTNLHAVSDILMEVDSVRRFLLDMARPM